MTDVGTQAVRSFGWAGTSLIGSRVVALGTTLVLARLLTPTDFGVVAAGMVLLGFLEMGLDLGIAAALVYEQEKGVSDRVQTAAFCASSAAEADASALASVVLCARTSVPLVRNPSHSAASAAMARQTTAIKGIVRMGTARHPRAMGARAESTPLLQ